MRSCNPRNRMSLMTGGVVLAQSSSGEISQTLLAPKDPLLNSYCFFNFANRSGVNPNLLPIGATDTSLDCIVRKKRPPTRRIPAAGELVRLVRTF